MSSKNLKEGDRVKIELRGNYAVEGTVNSANWYNDGGYYVEMTDDNGSPHYWKQIYEPGDIYKWNDGRWEHLEQEGEYRGGLTFDDLRSQFLERQSKNFR